MTQQQEPDRAREILGIRDVHASRLTWWSAKDGDTGVTLDP